MLLWRQHGAKPRVLYAQKGGERLLQVDLRDGETGDQLLARFTKMVQRDGILREVKARRHYVSPGEKARAARKKAARKRRKR